MNKEDTDQLFSETVALYKALQSFSFEPEARAFRVQILNQLSHNLRELDRLFLEDREQCFTQEAHATTTN